MPHPRRAIPLSHWPEWDQTAWNAANLDTDPLDDPGLAARWRPKTRHTVEIRYGLCLGWLRDRGWLDPTLRPIERFSRQRLACLVDDLRSRNLSPVTIVGWVRDLREAIRVMQLDADLSDIDHLLRRLDAVAEPTRDKRLRVVSPALLLDHAIAEMKKLARVQERSPSRRTATQFQVALMIAFLATRPVRLENFAVIELGKHLVKLGDIHWCRFGHDETKEKEPLEFPISRAVQPYLDRYLTVDRPLLLRGRDSSRVWISTRSTPLVDNSIYCLVTRCTKRLIDRRINPHLFRDCVATFIAEVAPEEIRIVARILGHSTLRTSLEHYNQARMLSAQRRYLEALKQFRDIAVSESNCSAS